MDRVTQWGERHQVALYLAALLLGAFLGIAVPASAPVLGAAVTPLLGLLLFATFLGVPFAALRGALRDTRFLVTVLTVNFLLVPGVVFLLSRFLTGERAVLLGALLVLLTPCVDYVIVFTGLAGGAQARLLAATPLLMLLQMVLLPGYLWLMAGADAVLALNPWPFIEAFLLLIVVPLALALLIQTLPERWSAARRLRSAAQAVMVPLMMATLIAVVASQASGIGAALMTLASAVLVFALFPLVVAPLAGLAARFSGLDAPGRRAVVFSGVTRNSLVVLPIALAFPDPLTSLTVVAQTFVELLAMVTMVALVPRLIADRR